MQSWDSGVATVSDFYSSRITMVAFIDRSRYIMENFSKAICDNPTFLNGKVFDRLTVICFDHKSRYGNVWKCQCDCGNIMYATTGNLTAGRTKSCGCLHDDLAGERNVKDICGMKFGMLTVISRAGSKNKKSIWNCACDCGGTKVVSCSDLKSGRVKSCGCLKSLGEKAIAKFLDSHEISYKREYTFPDCKLQRPMPFDFYIDSYGSVGSCIEYDGIQHFQDSRMYSSIPLEERIQRDKIKTDYCKRNGIRLLRISYLDYDNIESILNDWLFLNGENETSYSDTSSYE